MKNIIIVIYEKYTIYWRFLKLVEILDLETFNII